MSKYHTYLNLMDTNLDFIAEFISKRLKNVNKVTTEDVIEAVRLINNEMMILVVKTFRFHYQLYFYKEI